MTTSKRQRKQATKPDHKLTTKQQSMHHYVESGLDYVYLMNGFDESFHPEIGKTVAIHNLDGLHALITKCIIDKLPRIRGQELRYLRSELRLTQCQLGHLLGSSERTVQRWEEDRNLDIPEMADRFLRIFCAAHMDGKTVTKKVCDMLRDAQNDEAVEHQEDFCVPRLEIADTPRGWKAA